MRATFFQCGANVDRLPAIARAVAAAGHEIGNHSYAHPLFCFRSPASWKTTCARAQQAIARAHRRHARLVPRALRRALVRHWRARSGDWGYRRDVDRNRL